MAQQAKPDRYSAKEAVDELEVLSQKLAADLRKQIRAMASFPIASDQWNEMADVLGRLSHVSDMEAKLPSPKTGATLWETEELALRYVLEDGKLNLCLRNMVDFKQHVKQMLIEGQRPPPEIAPKFDKFEKGMGTVLRNAWNHVESLQTTELPLLISHIGDVLETTLFASDIIESYAKAEDLSQRQEVIVFYYLASLMKHLDDIHEDRIMPIIREKNIFMNGVKFLSVYYPAMTAVDALRALEALSGLVQTEDFQTYKERYVSHTDNADAFVLIEFRETVLLKYQDDFKTRRIVRPLLDLVQNLSRSFNFK